MDQHEKDCGCAICTLMEQGRTEEEAFAEFQRREQAMLDKYGWVAHLVGEDTDSPTGFNAHTHGLSDRYNHLDFQLIYPLPPEKAHAILKDFADRVKGGETFTEGQEVEKIIKNYSVRLELAEEGERPVLRIILPGPDGILDRTKMTEPYNLQYADLPHD